MSATVETPLDLPAAQRLLAERFGHTAFRPGQAEAIGATLAGRDAVVLMPTGSGKSLCYQLPAALAFAAGRGTTLVVSPLIALMNDQVDGLRQRGVAAAALHSGQDELGQRETIAHLLTGKLALLYVSPERSALAGFRRLLARARVAFLAIDEAHCISQWGHDFRPEYQTLGELRERLGVPTLALTATATGRVLDEIQRSLCLRAPVRVLGSFTRPNLRFAVRHLPREVARQQALLAALERAGLRGAGPGRAIVYCATRKKVEAVAALLKSHGYHAGHYHAGRTDLARERAQHAFELGRARVLVATNAFGMGIDQPDVRLIVHFHTPGSVEAYYQEAGRAGRDGLPADCLLFFGVADLVTQRFLNRKSARSAADPRREGLLAGIEAYARSDRCRQAFITRYFTGVDPGERCGCCDTCTGAAEPAPAWPTAEQRPVTCAPPSADEADVIVATVAALSRPAGKGALAKALRGSRARALRRFGLLESPGHGALAHHDERCLTEAIEALIREGRLERRGAKYPTVWLRGRPVRERRAADPDAPVPPTTRARRPSRSELWRALDAYRRRQARALGWKRYMVFNNQAIDEIAAQQPDSLWALGQVHGIGPSKLERFGADILALVRRHGA